MNYSKALPILPHGANDLTKFFPPAVKCAACRTPTRNALPL